jgi:hypothetical protein
MRKNRRFSAANLRFGETQDRTLRKDRVDLFSETQLARFMNIVKTIKIV